MLSAHALQIANRDLATKPGHLRSILIVENEDLTRELACSVLRADGYIVLSARNEAEALRALEDYPDKVDVLMTDIGEPSLEGLDLTYKLTRERPEMRVLLMSRWMSGMVEGLLAVANEQLEIMSKPFTRDRLLQTLNQLLDD